MSEQPDRICGCDNDAACRRVTTEQKDKPKLVKPAGAQKIEEELVDLYASEIAS